VDQGQTGFDERDRRERGDVRHGDQIGITRHLTDGPDGVPGEAGSLAGQHVDRLGRHQLGARLATEVDEHGQDEPRAGVGDQFGEGGPGRGSGSGCGHRWLILSTQGQIFRRWLISCW
jgi:hypothetical protein